MDLGGVQFVDGIEFQFPQDTLLAPGETVVIVKNTSAFQLRYGAATTPVGQYSGSLQNSGERITLDSPRYGYILDFEYSDLGPWPGRADGGGSSLELIDPDGNYGDGTQLASQQRIWWLTQSTRRRSDCGNTHQ